MPDLTKIKEALTSLGATVSPDFDTKMSNPDFAERVRTSLEGAGATVPDSATFYQKYAPEQQAKPSTPPSQPPPEPTWSEVLFPGASESVAASDPWYKQSGMALGDVSSLPGRLVGGMAEGIGANVGSIIFIKNMAYNLK